MLAGGNSSRMGADKALLPLAGKPLVEHAVTKLERLCAEVKVLGSNPALEAFAPLVPDLRPGCGPMGGIEAALLDSKFDWNLILPVDVPFLSTYYLDSWLWSALHKPVGRLRLAMVAVDADPQPTLLIVHRELAPFLSKSLEAGKYKLYPALDDACDVLATRYSVSKAKVFFETQYDNIWAPDRKAPLQAWQVLRRPGLFEAVRNRAVGPDMFANLNTPADFAEAERFAHHLDT